MPSSRRKKSKSSLEDRWKNGFEIGLIGLLVVLFFNLFAWPETIVDENLDGSWQAVLTYALKNDLHFGEDVIFTYGPLGSLSSFAYSGYNHAGKYAFELFMRFSAVFFLFRFLVNLRPYVKLGCLFLYLFTVQLLPDVYETYFFFGMLTWASALILEKRKEERGPRALLAVGIAYLVIASMVKFTLLIAAVFCFFIVLAFLFAQSREDEASGILVGFGLGFLGFWSLLGQPISNIPAYLYGSFQVAKGYAMSMQLPMQDGTLKYFILFLLSSFAVITVVSREHLRSRRKSSHGSLRVPQ